GYVTVATLPARATSYLDDSAPSGVLSVYRLRAISATGDTSPQVALTNLQMAFLEGRIPGFASVAAVADEGNAIALTWNLSGGNYDHLVLESRLGDSDPFVVVTDSLGGNATSYTDSGLASNTVYTYRIAG